MLRIFLQYISLLNRIRIAKMQGYKGLMVSSIYPINEEKLEKKGYSTVDPSIFRDYYCIRWVD